MIRYNVYHVLNSQRGRPAFDRIVMFNILSLQQRYGMAEDKYEHRISCADKIPMPVG
jgi:hypothetical protein